MQGINDLVTPFFQVFLSAHFKEPSCDLWDLEGDWLEEELKFVEADSFWCMTKLLDGIQVFVF